MDALALERVAREFGIELILEFGSMVTGQVHPRSDLDVALCCLSARASFAELADLRHELHLLHPITK